MGKQRKWPLLLFGGVLVLVMGVLASVALAQTATPEAETPSDEVPAHGFLPFGGFGKHGGFLGRSGESNRDENLAAALGITVEELQAAREEAFQTSIAEAVADGLITQEQADQMLAMQALRSRIDKQALLAEALGMTVDELEAALAEGQTMWDLMFEKEISPTQLQTNMQAAYEAAVAQAVTDGVITQEQADAILSGNMGMGGMFGGHGGRGGRGHGHHGADGFWGVPSSPDSDSDSTDGTTTNTSFDA